MKPSRHSNFLSGLGLVGLMAKGSIVTAGYPVLPDFHPPEVTVEADSLDSILDLEEVLAELQEAGIVPSSEELRVLLDKPSPGEGMWPGHRTRKMGRKVPAHPVGRPDGGEKPGCGWSRRGQTGGIPELRFGVDTIWSGCGPLIGTVPPSRGIFEAPWRWDPPAWNSGRGIWATPGATVY